MNKISEKSVTKYKAFSTLLHKKTDKICRLIPIKNFINKLKIGEQINELFPTEKTNAVKYSNGQIMLSLLLSSLSGINRAVRIANFTADSLVQTLLNLSKHLNKDVLGERLKKFGQQGSVLFQEYTFKKVSQWITESGLTAITIDCDSTVKTVYGNQQGAAKGYNPDKKGAKSYHPLLAFVSSPYGIM